MDPKVDALVGSVHSFSLAMLQYKQPQVSLCKKLAPVLRELYELRPLSEAFWKKFSTKAYQTPGLYGSGWGSHVTLFEFWRRIDKGVCKTFECGAQGSLEPVIMRHCEALAEACADMELEADPAAARG